MMRYEDKTALVTGGGSGIGRSICLRLASEGAEILILDIDLESAESVANEIKGAGGNATAFACDVANHSGVEEVVASILATTEIDVLVNNAGIAHVGNLENTGEADLDRLLSVNVKGVYNLLAAVVPAMKERGSGAILNMASVASTVGLADRFAYSTTKGAVLMMTYSVAKDYIDYGIRCNCVSPGRVHTPFVDRYLEENYPDDRDEMFDKLSKTQPIGRMGTPDEIAALVAYLCSDEAAFVTGSNFPIDGGFVTLNT
jgi:NAD(P)-dependent dehydrogenase (short-subunit alcohol dehydrogenase family)